MLKKVCLVFIHLQEAAGWIQTLIVTMSRQVALPLCYHCWSNLKNYFKFKMGIQFRHLDWNIILYSSKHSLIQIQFFITKMFFYGHGEDFSKNFLFLTKSRLKIQKSQPYSQYSIFFLIYEWAQSARVCHWQAFPAESKVTQAYWAYL